MRRSSALVFTLALFALPALPQAASGQLSVAPKIGTLGAGIDIGLGLGSMAVLRGGVGLIPIQPEGEFSDIDFELNIPGRITLGLDFHPGGSSFRISSGVMFQTDELSMDGEFSGSVDIGGTTYTDAEVGVLRGELQSGSTAPFVTLGFGKHGQSGVGFFIDAGVAFLGEPEVELTADGLVAQDPTFIANLQVEEDRIEDDLTTYGQFYPILNLGIRIGIGR